VHTPQELDQLLNDKDFNVADKLRLIEVYMPRSVGASVPDLYKAVSKADEHCD
jgi:hypothetical protein